MFTEMNQYIYGARYKATKAFVALDNSSGGYPYPAYDFRNIWQFNTKEEQKRYCDMFNDEIEPVTILIIIKPASREISNNMFMS